jgi:GTP-binding protein
MWRLINPRFLLGAVKPSDFPNEPVAAEFAIVGRSNVGKSSLLNALFGTRKMVKAARTPGKTRELNIFAAELYDGEDTRLPVRFVDLPGYGYAKVSQSMRRSMSQRIEHYVRAGRHTRALQLLDLKRPPSPLDHASLDYLTTCGPVSVVCTKCDQISSSQRARAQRTLQEAMGLATPPLLTSASKVIGIEKLLAELAKIALAEPFDEAS